MTAPMPHTPHAQMATPVPHTPDTQHQGGNAGPGPNRTALSATAHCLTGCAIGEILGMVLSTWWGWSNAGNVVLSVSLAFVFGYSLTMLPRLRGGLTLRRRECVAPREHRFAELRFQLGNRGIL